MKPVFLSFCFLVAGLGSARAAAPAAAATSAEADWKPVERLIGQWLERKTFPSAGLLIVNTKGDTVYERYWNGHTRSTVVTIGAASMWLEAAAALALVDAGMLDLDKPVSAALPALKGPCGENTLRQLLSHTGTLNFISLSQSEDAAAPVRLPAILAKKSPGQKPGEHFHFGALGMATAAFAVEEVAGEPWLAAFGERLARPLGMKSTVTGLALWNYDKIIGGDNFPRSSAADYLPFLRMLLGRGMFEGRRVLSEKAVREMEADQVRGAEVAHPAYPERAGGERFDGVYGLGAWRLVLDGKGEALVLASPAATGFFPWIDRRHGIAGVFVARSNPGAPGNLYTTLPRIAALVHEALATRDRAAALR
ncbi:beta-lactamase [Opitutaceae bacterium TAV5]|nr:beta-lactamase [Opitutaceae bacterium TAV5]